ncbi:response regulator [Bacteroidota bacterium]
MQTEREGLTQFNRIEKIVEILHRSHLPIALANSSKKILWTTVSFNKLFNINPVDELFTELLGVSEDEVELNTIYSNVVEHDIQINYFRDEKLYLIHINRDERILIYKNLAHDINNILTSILNSVSTLKNYIQENSKEFSLISTIGGNAKRAAALLKEQLGDKRKGEAKVGIDSKDLMNELLATFNNLKEENVQLIIDIREDLHSIKGNYLQLYRALLNVMINAHESISNEGMIWVSALNFKGVDLKKPCDTDQEFIKIIVKDSGIGIKEENLEKIFQRSFSTKNRSRESGLGLNISKELIECHGGSININSKWGEGTEVIIILPAILKQESIEENVGTDKNIIVADDEENILELLSDLLRSYNYNVFEAVNGAEVLDYAEQKNIDLIIIDKKMPNISGIECIRQLRNKSFDKPIILTTGSTSIKEELQNQDLSVDKIVIKPFDFEDMLKVVNDLLN